MLIGFRELLEERRAAGAAAGAFTCYDVTTALGVVRAAEAREVPVILLVGEASFRNPDAHLLVPALVSVADAARVPACIQIDHVSDPELIRAALVSGAGAVLADGSRLPVDENAALVRAAVDAAAPGVGVEAELGHIEGSEDVAAAAAAGALTVRTRLRSSPRGPAPTAWRSRSATCTAPMRHRRSSTGNGSSRSARASATCRSRSTAPPAFRRTTCDAQSASASARST